MASIADRVNSLLLSVKSYVDQDGSVDWDTLGNIITGNMLAEVR